MARWSRAPNLVLRVLQSKQQKEAAYWLRAASLADATLLSPLGTEDNTEVALKIQRPLPKLKGSPIASSA